MGEGSKNTAFLGLPLFGRGRGINSCVITYDDTIEDVPISCIQMDGSRDDRQGLPRIETALGAESRPRPERPVLLKKNTMQ